MQAVCHVVGFSSNLESLGFPQLEDSRQSHIELPYMGPLDIPRPHVPETSQVRQRKCGRVQIVRQRLGAVRIAKHELCALVLNTVCLPPRTVQCSINTAAYGEKAPGGPAVDTRQPP